MLGITTSLTDIFTGKNKRRMPVAGDRKLLLKKRKKSGSVFDSDFIEQKTLGFDDFKMHLQQLSMDELVNSSGIDLVQLKETADILKDKKKIIACWAMGLTQHRNAVDTIKEIVNLLLLKGSIGKPGAGTCPVRGHSNVQGDRTMGINERPSKIFLKSIEDHFHFTPPQQEGYDVVKT